MIYAGCQKGPILYSGARSPVLTHDKLNHGNGDAESRRAWRGGEGVGVVVVGGGGVTRPNCKVMWDFRLPSDGRRFAFSCDRIMLENILGLRLIILSS